MFENLYQTLQDIGYTHPLHPALTHLPVGLVLGGFIFSLCAVAFRQANLLRTARHCALLALIAVLPTALLGYADWQHFYGGAWLFPIKAKLVLAVILLILLILVVSLGSQADRQRARYLFSLAICCVMVVSLGYFGGELVYGAKDAVQEQDAAVDPLVAKGAQLFAQSCAMCHHSDQTTMKVGPGLKGLFAGSTLPVSGRPVTPESIRQQIKTPYKSMPAFPDMPEEEIQAIIAYLKTL